jgi:hypothetical protein
MLIGSLGSMVELLAGRGAPAKASSEAATAPDGRTQARREAADGHASSDEVSRPVTPARQAGVSRSFGTERLTVRVVSLDDGSYDSAVDLRDWARHATIEKAERDRFRGPVEHIAAPEVGDRLMTMRAERPASDASLDAARAAYGDMAGDAETTPVQTARKATWKL